MGPLNRAARALRRAVYEDKGPKPLLHNQIVAGHRREAPVIWRAIDAVIAAADDEPGPVEPQGHASHDQDAVRGLEVPGRYRKKPVVIEAMRYTGSVENCHAVHAFLGYEHVAEDDDICDTGISIETLEGEMTASPGDWIIKGVQGEFYPCKPDIFAATYEPAEEQA